MVWIHGGALVSGQSDDFDPGGLVRDGVVVVTINYRLGALGFLAHPGLAQTPGGPSGDYGLMDQQAALRWVGRDIGAFGGDPRDVTVFGQSAGGLSVLAQLVSPAARGLFATAIVQSGAYDPIQASLADAEAAGARFAAAAGCADQSAACLRRLPVSTLLANQDRGGYTPDVDGQVLVEPISTALASGRFSRVPVIDGTTHDEFRQFVALNEANGQRVTAASYHAWVSGTLSAVFGLSEESAAAAIARYPVTAYPSPAIALGTLGTDAVYACTALRLDRAMSRYVPVYAYEFNDENAPAPGLPAVSFPYGAAHASELPYLFDQSTRLSAPQRRLAATMRRYWTAFAAGGRPSPTEWPSFDATGSIQSLKPPGPALEADFATRHRCDFWDSLG